MKKAFLCLACAATALTLNAKVWRINYDENAKADFKTIKEACATTLVSDGDTLYMEPGVHAGSSTDNTISRPLTILGPGRGFKANNGATSAVPMATFTHEIFIRSNDVSVIGIVCLRIDGESSSAFSNIRIERCRVNGGIYAGYNGNSVNDGVSNITIRDNICYYINFYATELLTTSIIENNIAWLGPRDAYSSNTSAIYTSIKNYNGNHVIIRHNTVFGTISQGAYRMVYDNIIIYNKPIDFSKTYDNYRFYNNVLAISKEQYDADLTSVSPIGYSNYADNIFAGATFANTCTDKIEGIYFDDAMRYQVREDSPAKNAATDGTDCGAFGGEKPFVLYGRPEGIPYIYDVDVPAHPSNNQLIISFKVTGQNE